MRTTQVQRGLGASKLAIPSVGGTINILTGGDESANGALSYQTEVGNFGYFRNSLSGVFGSHEKGFLHVVGSYKTNRGFAEGLESTAYAYYLKGRKTIGNHNLSFTTFGVPQRHGQRSWQMQVFEYDTTLAQSLTDGQGLMELDGIIDAALTDSTSIVNRGGASTRTSSITKKSTTTSLRKQDKLTRPTRQSIRQSGRWHASLQFSPEFYFKPIVTVRDVWSISDRSTLTTTAYASFGRGVAKD